MPAAVSTLEMVLLLWGGVLAVLVGALALATRHRRSRADDRAAAFDPGGDRRLGRAPDRRRSELDRRVGLPDLRPHRVERRSPGGDRRRGVPDRRGMLERA